MKTRIYATPAVKGLILTALSMTRFKFVLSADQITVIVKEINVYTSRFAK